MDGPLDASAKLRNPTGGSIAIMCPACWRGSMAAGPDGIRDPAPNRLAASKSRCPRRVLRIVGSTDRHLSQHFHPSATRGPGGGRRLPVARATRHRAPHRARRPVGLLSWQRGIVFNHGRSRAVVRSRATRRDRDQRSPARPRPPAFAGACVALPCRLSGRLSSQAA